MDYFRELQANDGVRAVILTATGDRFFSAGLDIKEMESLPVVWYANVGCINSVAWARLLKDAPAERNIPMLLLDCDYIDPTYVNEAELKDKTETFFEMLEERKEG